MRDNIQVEKLVLGQLESNCYLIYDRRKLSTLIIDPADDADFISGKIANLHLKPVQIIATHGHFDHILAAYELQQAYKIPFSISHKDKFLVERAAETAHYYLKQNIDFFKPKINQDLNQVKDINLADIKLTVFNTPGHTPGSICLYHKAKEWLFCGDTLFADGGIGRTDFAYSSSDNLHHSIQSLLQLPGSTTLFPGHGRSSTIKEELKFYRNAK